MSVNTDIQNGFAMDALLDQLSYWNNTSGKYTDMIAGCTVFRVV